MPRCHQPVNAHTQQRQGGRGGKDPHRAAVILCAQRAAAYGGGDDGGKAPHRADEEPLAPREIREPREIAKEVFWCAGHHEDEPEEEVPPG